MTNLIAWWRNHRKAVIGYAGAVLTIAALVVPQSSKYYAIIPAVAAALGIHLTPNAPPAIQARMRRARRHQPPVKPSK